MGTGKCKNVMLIDDNEIDIFIGSKMLHLCNFAERVIEKKSSNDALNFLSLNSKNEEVLPEYIFLDLMMPVDSGFDFLDAFSQMPNSVKNKCKIVVLSVLINEDDLKTLAENNDVHKVVHKPLNENLLMVLAN